MRSLEGRTGGRLRSDNVAKGGFFEARVSLKAPNEGAKGIRVAPFSIWIF